MTEKAGPILIGIAYIALVVFIILFCAQQADTFDEYAQYWGLFATLVGVVTGAIPSYFFKTQADQAKEVAAAATETANKAQETATNATATSEQATQMATEQMELAAKESLKAQAYAGAVDPDRIDALHIAMPHLFK